MILQIQWWDFSLWMNFNILKMIVRFVSCKGENDLRLGPQAQASLMNSKLFCWFCDDGELNKLVDTAAPIRPKMDADMMMSCYEREFWLMMQQSSELGPNQSGSASIVTAVRVGVGLTRPRSVGTRRVWRRLTSGARGGRCAIGTRPLPRLGAGARPVLPNDSVPAVGSAAWVHSSGGECWVRPWVQ